MIEKLDIKDYENKEQLVWVGVINKLNALIDAVNGILDYAPLEMAMKAEPKTPAENVLTMVDNQAKQEQQASKDRLKEQLVSKCNQLEVAIESLKCICDIGGSKKIFEIPRHIQMWEEASQALEQITALEQKDE